MLGILMNVCVFRFVGYILVMLGKNMVFVFIEISLVLFFLIVCG